MISRLNPKINYEQNTELFTDDTDVALSSYISNIKNVYVQFALGSPKCKYIQYGVIFFPIYLISLTDEDPICIGVFEMNAGDIKDNIYDEYGDIHIDKFDEPILFDFVSVMFLQKYEVESDDSLEGTIEDSDDEDKEEVEEEIEEEGVDDAVDEVKDTDESIDIEKLDSDDEGHDDDKDLEKEYEEPDVLKYVEENIKEYDDDDPETYIPLIEPQTLQQAKKEKQNYSITKAKSWIQKYMKSLEYKIIDNEGGGDCFFAVVRDAFASIGKEISVSQLREIVAIHTTEVQYNTYNEMYMMFNNIQTEAKTQMKLIKNKIAPLQREYKKLSNSKTQDVMRMKQIMNEINELRTQYDDEKTNYYSISELFEHFSFMKNIKSLDDLRSYIMTRHYWADEHAITVVETILNIKMLIFSREEYNSGSLQTVVQCGSNVPSSIEEKGVFKPKYYIPTEYLGYHYTTIQYSGKKIFTFEEIPFDVKRKVSLRCLEGLGGIYKFIPKFKHFYNTLSNLPDYSKSEIVYKVESDEVIDDKEDDDGVMKEDEEGLYDDSTVLQFYKRSSDKFPGQGNGEKLNMKHLEYFTQLDNIEHWRRVLDNNYIDITSPFMIDDLNWASVNHYYHASKYKENNPELYNQFSLDSGSEISTDIKLANDIGRMTKKYKSSKYYDATLQIDDDFYPKKCKDVKYKALRAKFTQVPLAKQILELTKPALLLEYKQGRPIQPAIQLMKVRNEL